MKHSQVSKLLAAISVISLVVSGVALVESRNQWNPLGPYPEQQATPKGDGHIYVEAIKCAREQVEVRGMVSWQSAEPNLGTFVPAGSGYSERPKGCVQLTFNNPIPEKVKEIVREQHIHNWRITGQETPFRENKEGVTKPWRTSVFTLTEADL